LFLVENGNGSDSDVNSDDATEYYQPISAVDDDGSSDGEDANDFHQIPNGYTAHGGAVNGISMLDLNDEGVKSSDDEEEEEERSVEEVENEIQRALREEERRRIAPLTAENATRVMEAMRGISFVGEAPRWVSEVPEERWIDQIRRRRQSSNT